MGKSVARHGTPTLTRSPVTPSNRTRAPHTPSNASAAGSGVSPHARARLQVNIGTVGVLVRPWSFNRLPSC